MQKLPAPTLPTWIASQVPYERYQIWAGEHRMHVMERGRGATVLLVHGNPTWGYLWRKVVERLPEDTFRCVMPDLIGLGFSDKPRDLGVHHLENHARWMREAITELDLRDVILVVQDWGGAIGALGFEGQEDRLAGLVVLNTALSEPKPGFKPTAFHRLSQAPVVSDLLFRGLGFPQIGLQMAQGDRTSMLGRTGLAYWFPLRKLAERGAPLAMARMVPDTPEHPSIAPLIRCRELVERFEGPASIVWGKRDPVLGRVLNWMRKLLPEAPVTETGAGHFLQEEVPGEIAAAIRDVHRRAFAHRDR